MIWSTPKTHQSRDVPIPRSLIDALVVQAMGKKPGDVLFSSPNGEPIGLADRRQRVLGLSSRRGRPQRTYTSRPSTHCSILGNVWRVGKTHTPDARSRGRGDDLERLRVAVWTTWTTSPTALTRPCWKVLRPVCGLSPAAILKLPKRTARTSLSRPNASAPPVGFEPTTQGLGNLCSIP